MKLKKSFLLLAFAGRIAVSVACAHNVGEHTVRYDER